MELSKALEALDYKIAGGSEHCWTCYGFDARYLDFESDYAHASIIFDTKNQTVYCAEINGKENDHSYRWLNPEYKQNYLDECKEKNVDPNNAWDNHAWADLETAEDWLTKASAITRGLDFDKRVVVPLDLDDDTLFLLFTEAHKRDVTLNEMVEIILQEAINRQRNTNLMR